jgi:hypothetical protein
MSFTVVSYGEASEIEDLNQFADCFNGKADYGQPILLTALSDAAHYALTVKNLESGSCKVLQLLDHADAHILDVDGDQIKVGWPIVMASGVAITTDKVIAQTLNSSTDYPLVLKNLDATNARLLQVKDHADVDALLIAGDKITAGWSIAVATGKYVEQHAKIHARQGELSTGWAVVGTTEYNPTNIMQEWGADDGGSTGAAGNGMVTFKHAFAYTPHVMVTVFYPGVQTVICNLAGILPTGFSYQWQTRDGSAVSTLVAINWVATGTPA